MVRVKTGRLKSLERWSPKLFLATGVLFLAAAVNQSIVLFRAAYDAAPVGSVLLLLGLLTAFVGLIGLYPRVAGYTSWLAGLALAAAALTLVGVVILLVWGLANTAGLAPETSPVFAIGMLLLMIASFTLFGVAIIYGGAYTTRISILLLAEAVALVLVFAIPALFYDGNAPATVTIGIETVQALILLAAGFLLGTELEAADSVKPAAESTV